MYLEAPPHAPRALDERLLKTTSTADDRYCNRQTAESCENSYRIFP